MKLVETFIGNFDNYMIFRDLFICLSAGKEYGNRIIPKQCQCEAFWAKHLYQFEVLFDDELTEGYERLDKFA